MFFVILFFVLSFMVATGVLWMLKEGGLHYEFISRLPSYSIDGLLVFLGIALAANYKSEAGKLCFFYMIVGVALMIGCHLVLHGLPAYDKDDPAIRSVYAIFGSFFYLGITISLSTACLGLYRRDTKERDISQDHK
ncbi:hypothetical protein [Halomonas sp. BN3-1]|uniref:hypothetical protein n=1 Tax=Halomonas sp. BN3-1 TaxID=2082393 RepID=UPI0013B45860|nr:hypothetical protein [Halomonas sp. BN3-1]